MPVRVSANFTVGTTHFTDTSVMREVGLLARELIRRRTARGISADGTPFKPYTPAYAAQKRLAVSKSSPVDLTVSGGMLNALQVVEVTDKSVTLGFA